MRIEGLKEKLQEAVSIAERVTGKNLTLPVLSCIELTAKDNTLTLRATNLDLGLEINLPVKVTTEGKAAVPGGVFSSFLTNLPNDKSVTLEVKEGNLLVSTPHSSTIIKTFPHDDFPTIPAVEKDATFTLAAKDFVKGLRSVWYSSATSSMKPELSSVYIHTDEDFLVFAATDSFRLAEKRIKIKKVKEIPQILIPFKNVPEIIKILDSATGDIELSTNKNQLAISFGGTYLTTRIIDGVFPDYKQIIPKESKTEVVVLKQDLINALKISNIFSDKFHQLNIHASPKTKRVELKTKNSDVGENQNSLQAALTGEEIEINFNYKYIADCFQSVDADSVSLSFNGLNKPLVIRGVSDRSFMYLVMPMNR